MFNIFLLAVILGATSASAEETARDKLVKNAQRVEKGVLKDLGSLREKGCKLLKNKECVPSDEQKETKEIKEEKSN